VQGRAEKDIFAASLLQRT